VVLVVARRLRGLPALVVAVELLLLLL
jgi:hypothetical protein